jgi:hypothetical protein
MTRLAPCLLTAALALSLPAIAQASAMPRADFEAGRVTASASINGLFYIVPFPIGSVDYALTDRLSLGAAASAWMALGRATLKVWESSNGLVVGVTAAGGFNNEQMIFGTLGPILSFPATSVPGARIYSPGRLYEGPWGQVALTASWPVLGPRSPIALRGMVGPALGNAVFAGPMATALGAVPRENRLSLALLPNAELAFRLHPRHEITLGGFGYLGYRGTF